MPRIQLRRTLVAAVAAATLTLPGVALAASPSTGSVATNPATLTGTVQGNLAGNSGGSFDYLQFNYPGDGSTVTLDLTVDNTLPLQDGAAGINIYQNGNLLATSGQNGPNSGEALFSGSTAGPILVQVFNYEAGTPIAFTLTPQGLPAQTQASAPAATSSTTTAATASSATSSTTPTLGGSASGTLAASTGGSFALYRLAYPGNSQNVTLSLSVSPVAPAEVGTTGLNVYDQDGNLVGTASPSEDPSVLSLTLNNASAATYTIQVFNYDPSTSVSYTLIQAAS